MHIMGEHLERSNRYHGVRLVPKDEDVREWVWTAVDWNRDRKITPDEAIKGFKKVVMEIRRLPEQLR